MAPALPPDTTSINRSRDVSIADFAENDRAMSCDAILAERRQIADTMQADNRVIEGNRTRNQVATYLGAYFLVPFVATDNNNGEKDQITQLYQRNDTLIKFGAVKNCPMPP